MALYGTLVFEMRLFAIVRPGATSPSILPSGDLLLLGKLRAVYDTYGRIGGPTGSMTCSHTEVMTLSR